MKSKKLKWFAFALLLISPACSKPKFTKPPAIDYYACTMHPSVHAEEPGKCPICGMELVPVMKKGASNATPPEHAGHGQLMPGMPMPAPTTNAAEEPGEFTVPVQRLQQIGSYRRVHCRAIGPRSLTWTF